MCVHVCMRAYVCACMLVCASMCVCVHAYVHACVLVRACVHVYLCIGTSLLRRIPLDLELILTQAGCTLTPCKGPCFLNVKSPHGLLHWGSQLPSDGLGGSGWILRNLT